MANIVIMPKQGLQMTEGLITRWLKKVGDEVKEGEPLFEMETDKLTITIDSSFSGTLLKIIRDEGEEVPITEPIAVIGEAGEDIGAIDADAPKASAASGKEEKPQTASSYSGNANVVIMPKQGLQMTEGLITKWLKKVGDEVKEGEPLFEMETDKLTITIDSSFSGTLLKIIRDEGEEVPITEPIALIGNPGDDVSGFSTEAVSQPTATAAPVQESARATEKMDFSQKTERAFPGVSSKSADGRVFITPRAKMRCAERGITDYSVIPGSGGDGLIIERDVLAYRIPEPAPVQVVRNVSHITVRADVGGAEKYVSSAAEGGVDFDMAKLIRKAADAAAKRYEIFENVRIRTLCETDVEEYSPSLPAEADILLSVGGIYAEGERRVTVLCVAFDEDMLDAGTAAAYLSRLKSLLENPLLMMAI